VEVAAAEDVGLLGANAMKFAWLGQDNVHAPLILTAPHSGETVPPEAEWLRAAPQSILLTDVDRFVHELYLPATSLTPVPLLYTTVHRYAADLNRYPSDVDQDSVTGSAAPKGAHPKGFHWVATTQGFRLMNQPITSDLHDAIVRNYHDGFHDAFLVRVSALRARFPKRPIFHLDCHSMPSKGTGAHRDQGNARPDVVISDLEGKSASAAFKDLVISSFTKEQLKVSYNWPYLGGRITERYGKPSSGHETIQIELNRALYMDEATREKTSGFPLLQQKLVRIIASIAQSLST
jgi:N-formylglutamate deformylase